MPGAVPSTAEIAEIAVIAVLGGSPRGGPLRRTSGPSAHVGVTSRPRSPLARSYRAVPPRWAVRVTWRASLRPARSSHIPRGRAQAEPRGEARRNTPMWASPCGCSVSPRAQGAKSISRSAHQCPCQYTKSIKGAFARALGYELRAQPLNQQNRRSQVSAWSPPRQHSKRSPPSVVSHMPVGSDQSSTWFSWGVGGAPRGRPSGARRVGMRGDGGGRPRRVVRILDEHCVARLSRRRARARRGCRAASTAGGG